MNTPLNGAETLISTGGVTTVDEEAKYVKYVNIIHTHTHNTYTCTHNAHTHTPLSQNTLIEHTITLASQNTDLKFLNFVNQYVFMHNFYYAAINTC